MKPFPHTPTSRTTRLSAAGLLVTLAVVVPVAVTTSLAPSASAATPTLPLNPISVQIDGHPANSGFLAFVEGDMTVRSGESEGTVAMGGDLHVRGNYNVAGAGTTDPTYTAPGDARPTYLHVGGGVSWENGGADVYVQREGFTKIARTATYSAYNRDSNNAQVNYKVVKPGARYESQPKIEGRTNLQTPASIGTVPPSSLIDIPAAFAAYRSISSQLAGCPSTVELLDRDQGMAPLPRPIKPGAKGVLQLVPGRTNVLSLTTDELRNLSEITFADKPTASTPLLVNVTGTTFDGNTPNLAGIGGVDAPYILWNFPTATSIRVVGGATIEGTIYAPNAAIDWQTSNNIEGNVISARLDHGQGELHDFPFDAVLDCSPAPEKPTLTLVKQVVNDDGGTAVPTDWTLFADGGAVGSISGATGDPAVTGAEVEPGTYALSESGPGGYDAGEWTCDGGTLAGAEVTLADGDDVTCTIVNDDTPAPPAHLTLVKQVVNDDGGTAAATDWTLSADGGALGSISGATGDDAVTFAEVAAGTYTLGETGPDGYASLGWECAWGPPPLRAGRASRVVADPVSTVTLAPGDVVTCTVTNDDLPLGPPTRLTLVKQVVNDDGGTAVATDWTLTADGGAVGTISGPTGDPSVTGVQVAPGTYALTETGPDGYESLGWSCVGLGVRPGDGSRVVRDAVVLAPGDDVTCTVVNDDVPPLPTTRLTLVKQVVNDDGGTAVPTDWTLTADGGALGTISGPTGDASVTAAEVQPGSYTLGETGPDGYEALGWTCVDAPPVPVLVRGARVAVADDQVTLEAGDDVTCTIVNDDRKTVVLGDTQLTLVKQVVNDDGGTAVPTDWTLTADGADDDLSGPTGTPEVTGRLVAAGTYQLGESGGPDGYDAGEWTCDGGVVGAASVTLAEGDKVTCTIVNDDRPARLTLVKVVVNDDGGTADAGLWQLTAEQQVDDGVRLDGFTGDAEVTDVPVPAGTYALSEDGPTGYASLGWDCVPTGPVGVRGAGDAPVVGEDDTVELGVGDDVTCTVTNDDVAPRLTLVKDVVNDDGGTAVPTDWTLSADGPTPITGLTGDAEVTGAVVLPGDYDLTEADGPDGYAAAGWTCVYENAQPVRPARDAALPTDGEVTIRVGDVVTCTVVNDDVAPHLTLVKRVVNDDEGTAVPTDWTLAADGPVELSGVTGDATVTGAEVEAGDYSLTESGGPGEYDALGWVCSTGTVSVGGGVVSASWSLDDGALTLAPGENVTCTITNDDRPTAVLSDTRLTLVKVVVNDDGGTAVPTDWTLSADGPTAIAGVTGSDDVTDVAVEPGDYTLAESGGPEEYRAEDGWSCDGGTVTGDVVTIAESDHVTCTIVNDDRLAVLPSGETETPTSTMAVTVPPSVTPTDDGYDNGTGSLPNAGGPPLGLLTLAAGLLLAGTAFLVGSRRRPKGHYQR
ncbi:hypothetical protein GCM10023340_21190 [Nocardioides marinquilinus]|uniref:Choice-of-anchor A family protein n=1 Tax=Nocardioides marinquilinus TaxID=1210400 RepID=A0ABP9PK71_9ACTN